MAVLYLGDNKIDLLGEKLAMEETKSVHFSISVSIPDSSKCFMLKETVCLAMKSMESLSENEITIGAMAQ